jgi:hypothetical protein
MASRGLPPGIRQRVVITAVDCWRTRSSPSRLLVRAAGSGDAEASVGVLIEKHRRLF